MNTLSNPNALKTASLAVITGIGFSACIGAPDLNDSPKDRFIHDYVRYSNDNGGVDCLSETAYDLKAGEYGRSSVTPPSATFDSETGILTITPTSGKNSLHLEGFGQNKHRVTPVGPDDEAIFDSYGCKARSY